MKFKFRAWDTENKVMLYPNNSHNYLTTYGGSFFLLVCSPYSNKQSYKEYVLSENLIVMMSTGLKSKNNEEIYEGDIIGYNNPKMKSVVCFGDYSFMGDEYGEHGLGFYLDKYEDRRNGWEKSKYDIYDYPKYKDNVIGNIYEDRI